MDISGPINPKEGMLYKIKNGVRYRKKEGKSWKKCCKNYRCWNYQVKRGLCKFHLTTKHESKIYYMTLHIRRNLNPICGYVRRNNSARGKKGKMCGRNAEYCKNNGEFVCTNHVNVLKKEGNTVYNKRDKKDIPDGIIIQ